VVESPTLGPFDRDTAVRLEAPSASGGLFAAEVSPEWRAGRGPHGGYLAAMLLRAMIETVGDAARAPRSLTVHYPRAPEPGPVRIHTVLERTGRSLSTLSARMERDGSVCALALAAFSVPWSAPEVAEIPLPDLAAPDPEREAGTMRAHGAPPFTSHLVFQQRVGSVPFSGSEQPLEVAGWLGLAHPRAIDALSLAFFCDALFPPVLVHLSEPAVCPTVDLTVHFRSPGAPRTDPGELCLARFRTGVVHEGFFEEDGIIWGADGTVLAQSRQLGILMGLSS
jgi:acyl-coenzyme A thioesterase PaaI-like protein